MDDYHLELLLKMKNINNKYIFFLQETDNNGNNVSNNNVLEKELLKNVYQIYNKFNLLKEKPNFTYLSFSLLQFYNKIINDKIIECCPHQFVEDDIDISPDLSKKIYYCSICENNLDDCIKK